MLTGIARVSIVAVAGLWLAGCSTSNSFSDYLKSKTASAGAPAQATDAQAAETSTPQRVVETSAPQQAAVESTGSVPPPLGVPAAAEPGLLGSDPNDDLSLGKKHYRANDFGLAEKHFRRAVESHPRDAEAWLGLAASYDRLRRFDLADRAYAQAIGIVGPTVAILNNQGYSYMLRGDYKRAHATLVVAQRKDPTNKYVLNNIRLLEASYRKGKAIE
ncbi:MAG TPA: tetratricopeptide repeat protein [Pseudolabrys sp.]